MKLLVTGAAGKIGRMLRPRLAVPGRTLRLADRTRPPAGADGAELVALDVADPAAVETACAGVDAVVHLAAIAGEASFSDVVRVNVHGSANVLASAQRAGVATVVIASSIHAVGYYTGDDAGPDGLADDVPP